MEHIDEHRETRDQSSSMLEYEARGRTIHTVPLIDLVSHAQAAQKRSRLRRIDVIATVTIYAAAVLTTAGFVIASIIDEILRPKRGSLAKGGSPRMWTRARAAHRPAVTP